MTKNKYQSSTVTISLDYRLFSNTKITRYKIRHLLSGNLISNSRDSKGNGPAV